MITFKFISTILISLAVILVEPSVNIAWASDFVVNNSDTSYVISTQQLKSDKIPDSVFSMTQLRHLSITGMDCDIREYRNISCWMISELPPKIKNLKNLTSLSLTLAAINHLPPELAELKQLKFLDLTDTGLSDITPVSKIPGLEYLYLYGCGLTKLPADIGNLKNLKELGLVGNQLDKAEQNRIKKALPNCTIRF